MEDKKEEGLNIFSDQEVDQNIVVPTSEETPVVPLFEEVDNINTTIPLFEEVKEITPIYDEPVAENVEVFPVIENNIEEMPVLEESNVFNYGEALPVEPIIETPVVEEFAPIVEPVPVVEEAAEEIMQPIAVEETPIVEEFAPIVEPVPVIEEIAVEETPVEVTPVYEGLAPVEPVVEETIEEVVPTPDFKFSSLSSEDIKVEPEQIDEITDVLSDAEITEFSKNKPMEHPDAKITLNRKEEIRSNEEAADEIRVSLKENSTLKFVFGLGIVLLIALLAIPYLSKLIMY